MGCELAAVCNEWNWCLCSPLNAKDTVGEVGRHTRWRNILRCHSLGLLYRESSHKEEESCMAQSKACCDRPGCVVKWDHCRAVRTLDMANSCPCYTGEKPAGTGLSVQ